jgi:uncharacterized membrane protein
MAGVIEQFVLAVSSIVEGLAAIIVGYGVVEAFYHVTIPQRRSELRFEHARIDLGRRLIVGLEFELGADILKTAISPTWTYIGIVGAILVLRTTLNYVLEREIEHLEGRIGSSIR